MTSIYLKGREIPLLYTTWELKTVQEEICGVNDLTNRITGRNPEDPEDGSLFGGPEHLDALAKLIRILGNAGLEEAGEEPNLTDKKVLRSIHPTQIGEMIGRCIEAMTEGMQSERPDEKKNEPVDVVLEQIKKKETKDG